MIHKETAMALRHGQQLWHVSEKNADGTPVRARVNGKCVTWQKLPDDFKLPMKQGMKRCFYISNVSQGYDWGYPSQWCLPDRWEIEKHWQS